jgi:integrase
MRGLGNVYKRGPVWWIRYHHRGREYRESTQSTERAEARELLRQRLGDLHQGRLSGLAEERVTFEELSADYLQERAVRVADPKALKWSKARVDNLGTLFSGMRAVDITVARIREFAAARLADDKAAGTINRDLGVLRRMFILAIQSGKLSRRPHFRKLTEAAPRQGFLEHAEYLAIRRHLPADHQDILDFAYLTGWRRGEVLGLEWRDLDRAGGVIRLRPDMSKTREGRVLVLSEPLREVIERRWRGRAVGVPLVFHRDGRSLDHFKDVWRRACNAAGMPRKLFHDLRRTAVRNMVRAGIPERVAMQVSGHKTRSIFDRYNIVSETDLLQAAERLAAYVGHVGA